MTTNSNFREWYGDVFEHFESRRAGRPVPYIPKPDTYFLVQTISGDCAMGAGIAKEINKRYGFRDILVKEYAFGVLGFPVDGWQAVGGGEFKRVDPKTQTIQKITFDRAIGDIVMNEHKNGDILALVTKKRYFEKPTEETMEKALDKLREFVDLTIGYSDPGVIELIMPHIGCGLDKMDWEVVKGLLILKFSDLLETGQVMITVMYK